MKVELDQSGCIGCGLCADVCPEVFCMTGDGLAEVCGTITDQNKKDALEAEQSCPANVISID